MIPDSDKKFGLRQAKENDQRITRVGRILRGCMDELPQIINILRGEMSFVGPRAFGVQEIIFDKNGAARRVRKNSGVSSPPGRASRPHEFGHDLHSEGFPAHRKFRYDLYYIRKLSFGLDLRLIALSFWISFRGKWETRQRKV